MGGVQLQQQTSPAGAGMGLGMAASGQQPLFGSTPAFGAASSIGGTGTYACGISFHFFPTAIVYAIV